MSRRLDLVLRIVAAALVLAGGIVHFKLWNDGYRDIDKVGPSFFVNAVASAAAAAALVVWRHWLALLGALGVVVGTLFAFGLSRIGHVLFDFNEKGWNPSPEAALALVFELAAAAVLVTLLFLDAARRDAAATTPSSSPDIWAPPTSPPG